MDRFDRPRQALAIAIAFLAGLVDAVGFVSADRYFVSFMSGNTTRLAVDLVTQPVRAGMPALLILGFVMGVAGGKVAATRAGRWRKPVLMTLVALLLAIAGLLHGAGVRGAVLGAMVLAMGAVNNAFQRDGETAVGLTYMTGALVRLGQGIGAALVGERLSGWSSYLLLWCGLFAGAIAGALLFTRLGGTALWLASLLALLLAIWAWRIAQREPR
ncbi:MAG TPA: YoaK family protein [Novosphingobium sp.]